MIDINALEDEQAKGIGSCSLVGVMATEDDFPLNHGNYFGLMTDTGEYEIANFWYEDLEYLLNKGIVSFPIPLKLLGGRWALIHDPRIPDDFYSDISYRAPKEFWSIKDLAKRQRKIDTGEITILGNGIECQKIKTTRRKLDMKWGGPA